jgi:hypothetical protein
MFYEKGGLLNSEIPNLHIYVYYKNSSNRTDLYSVSFFLVPKTVLLEDLQYLTAFKNPQTRNSCNQTKSQDKLEQEQVLQLQKSTFSQNVLLNKH